MKSKILFKTRSNNQYFYSLYKKQVFLCNPVLAYILKLDNESVDIAYWIKNVSKDDEKLKKLGNISHSELIYQYSKYKFLHKYDYFKEIYPKKKLVGKLSPGKVKSNLTEIKQIIFEVTEKCNLKCSYCTYSKYYLNEDNRSNKEFNIDQALTFIKYIERFQNNKVFDRKITISFYGGEPLLNFPFIEKIVYYLTTESILKDRVEFSMTTNGLLLNKYLDFLVKYDFKFAISLDGNKYNNQYRLLPNGKESFGIVERNIEFIQNKYPKFFKDNIHFLSVIHNRNSLNQIFNYTYTILR